MIDHLYTMIIMITYDFISLKSNFLSYYINPICPRYILHILHEHPSDLLIVNLKALRDSDSFSSLGNDFIGQRFSAMPDKKFFPFS